MLTRVIVLNSKVYGKAEVRLDDCDSLQLVGPNNIGKSTLIYALNFLFIIDGQKMSFSGNRKGDKETIHHYFPNHNQSFIVFEVFKKSYYSIIVKRDADSNLEYFKFDSEYKEEYFVDEDKRLLKFEEVKDAHDPSKMEHKFVGFETLTPGTMNAVEYDNAIGDLVAYLQWMGEPAQNERKRLGVWVVMFMALLATLAWRLNASYWKEVK